MSVTTTQVGNLQITTQVAHVSETARSGMPRPSAIIVPITSKYFKKIPVKALSAILMLVGILQLLMGIVFYVAEISTFSLTLKSGVYIWGGLAVFAAGGASLTAFLLDTINMVKVCMGCNTANIVVAPLGLILFAIQTYYENQYCWTYINSEGEPCANSTQDYVEPYMYHYNYRTTNSVVNLRIALNIIILLFSLLGLIISCFMTSVSFKILKSTGYNLMR